MAQKESGTSEQGRERGSITGAALVLIIAIIGLSLLSLALNGINAAKADARSAPTIAIRLPRRYKHHSSKLITLMRAATCRAT